MRAERSYVSTVCSLAVSVLFFPILDLTLRYHAQYSPARTLSRCPAILLGIPGPHLTVAGATIGDALMT